MENNSLILCVHDEIKVREHKSFEQPKYHEDKPIFSPFNIYLVIDPCLHWTPTMARAPSFFLFPVFENQAAF